MDRINKIPFYNCNVSLKSNNEIEKYCSDNKCQNCLNEYMSSDVSSASRAYGLSFVNKNKTIPQMSLRDIKELTYNTTPQQYENYLKNNKIDYKIEYSGEEDDNRSVHINVYSKDKKVEKSICFYYGKNKFDEHFQFVSQSDINLQGKEFRRLFFDKDNVEVITYVNYS